MSALTCARCGESIGPILTGDNGIARHCTPMQCIAVLKQLLAEAREAVEVRADG